MDNLVTIDSEEFYIIPLEGTKGFTLRERRSYDGEPKSAAAKELKGLVGQTQKNTIELFKDSLDSIEKPKALTDQIIRNKALSVNTELIDWLSFENGARWAQNVTDEFWKAKHMELNSHWVR